MSQGVGYINILRKNSLRLFRYLGRDKGVMPCVFFAIAQNVEARRNIYHDTVDISTDPITGVKTWCFVELNAPLKVVSNLGWWKEGETLPTLMYLPFQSDVLPAQECKVVIAADQGYMADTFIINKVAQFGQDVPVAWVCTVSSKRTIN